MPAYQMTDEIKAKISLARKGSIPWNKGISTRDAGKSRPKASFIDHCCVMCEKVFQAYRADNRKCCSIQCARALTGLKIKGANHYRWKDGSRSSDVDERVKFRCTMHKKVLERDDYTCVQCNNRGGSLQVDHIKSWARYPELRFNIDNCQTLCMDCHYKKTFKKEKPEGVVWGHNLKRRIAS